MYGKLSLRTECELRELNSMDIGVVGGIRPRVACNMDLVLLVLTDLDEISPSPV